jgi:hypothetical protein
LASLEEVATTILDPMARIAAERGTRPQCSRPRPGATLLRAVCVLLLFFAAAVSLQWLGGAYSAEFSGYPDEPAHYITGLMVRDYLAAGLPMHPMEFAEQYYLHYPKVAFGMWGPLFPVMEGVWMLAFSGSRTSILLLMALITSLLAFTLYVLARREFGTAAGLAAGLALMACPVVQEYGAMVMGDTGCALFSLCAALWFGRFLETGAAREAIWFGAFATLAILAKPSGQALALVPPIAILLAGRVRLMKTRAFWYPAVIVLVLAGPWQYFEYRLLTDMHREVSLETVVGLVRILVAIPGSWLFPVVLLGIAVRVVKPALERRLSGRWASLAALLAAAWIYHAAVPTSGLEPRYMIAAIGPVIMFFAAGVHWLAQQMSPDGRRFRAAAAGLTLVAAGVFAVRSFAIPQKAYRGFSEVAEELLAHEKLGDTVFLVSSEAGGEGLLVSEVAMREKRPGHVILRASKVLSQSDWMSGRYKLLRSTPEEIMHYLESVPVGAVIVDRQPGRETFAHHGLLLETLDRYAGRWQLAGSYPRKPDGPGAQLDIYLLTGAENRTPQKIRVDLPYTLGRSIEKSPSRPAPAR